VTEAMIRTD